MVRVRRRWSERPRAGDAEPAYAAFLSYSHAADDRLAGALQRAIQRLAKPWYRMRALRVFRDQSSLAANPALWPSIQDALDRSEAFILLACPQAADSAWVRREIEHWLRSHGSPERLLIVLTGGTIVWDRQVGEFDWERTDALPTHLRGVFTDEPLHVDLRWARDAEDLSLREPRFLDHVASLAAPLHGRSKQDLVGEDVRQHRRTVLLARAAVGSLAALAAAASIASVFAIAQRNEARVERDRATMQQQLATSRLMAAQARVMLEERPDRALLLAASAVRTSNHPDARDALLRAVQRTSNVTAYMNVASPVHGLAFSPDGQQIATGNQDRAVQLWNVSSARPRGPPRTDHRWLVQGLAFDPSGNVVSIDRNGAVVRWDPADGRAIGSRIGSGATHLAVHPRGRQVATGYGNGDVAVWNLRTGHRVRSPQPWPGADRLTASVAQLGYSLDGRWLGARTFDGRLIVREAASFDVVMAVGADPVITSFAFSPDGDVLALGHDDGSIVLVEPRGGRERDVDLTGHSGPVNSLTFAPDGRQLASGGDDRTLRLWDVDDGTPIAIRTAHGAPLTHVVYAPDGRALATGDRDGLVALWRLASRLGDEIFVEEGSLRSVALAADGGVGVFGHRGEGLIPWRLDGARRMSGAVPGSAEWIEVLALSRDGRVAASGDGSGRVTLWDVPAGRRLRATLDSDTGGRTLLHTLLAALKVDPEVDLSDFTPLVIDPDGSFVATASFDNRISLWSIDEDSVRETLLEGHRGPVSSLAFSPDGRVLASGDLTGDVVLWDTRDGTQLDGTVRAHGVGVRALAFSPDGTLLASGDGDGTVRLWRVADRTVVGDLTGHTATVTVLAFSPDGTRLASGAGDGVVRLWDLSTYQGLGEPFEWHLETVRALAFTADGSRLVSASRDGTISWLLDADAWIELACEIANRDLRPEEWNQLIGDGPSVDGCDGTPD